MTSVPKEKCVLVPVKTCNTVTENVPSLELVTECEEIPKEVCAMEKVNPRPIKRPVVKLWCNGTPDGPIITGE